MTYTKEEFSAARLQRIEATKAELEAKPPFWAISNLGEELRHSNEWTSMDVVRTIIERDYLLQQIAHVYYNDPELVMVRDADFDKAKLGLIETYAMYPPLKPKVSIIDMVGSPVASGGRFEKYTHRQPMMSLGNIFTEQELHDWVNKIRTMLGKTPEFCMEYKYDGLAVELHYMDGKLITGSTRGDGLVGDDVTENLRTLRDIPKRISEHGDVTVTGEVLMLINDFYTYNANTTKPAVNPRNAAAGSLRLASPEDVAERPLSFYPYNLMYNKDFSTRTGEIDLTTLHGLGFHNALTPVIVSSNPAEIYTKYLETYNNRDKLDFEFDGMVIKLATIEDRIKLSTTELRREPMWAIAFKFPTVSVETILLDVVFQVGRHGTITPVAKVEPVMCGGVEVSSITLHNRHELTRHDYRIGDKLSIHRAGEVIPQILNIVDSDGGRLVTMPDECPCCGNVLVVDGAATICESLLCEAQAVRRLEHFVSRDAFNIMGVGGEIMAQLHHTGLIRNPFDIFSLSKETLLSLDGWQETSVDKFLAAVNTARTIKLNNFIYALGCPALGRRNSLRVAEFAEDLATVMMMDIPDYKALDKIGEVIAVSAYEFMRSEVVASLVDGAQSAGIVIVPVPKDDTSVGILSDKRICITGKFNEHTRDTLRIRIKSLGGVVTDSVTKTTDYLICGRDAGSKLTKAENNGFTTIITEADLNAFLA